MRLWALRLFIFALLTKRTRTNADSPPLLRSASRWRALNINIPHASVCTGAGGRAGCLYCLSAFRRCSLGRLKVGGGASRLSDLHFIPDRRWRGRGVGGGGVLWGCGQRSSQAGLNDRALFGAAAPVSIGPSQTIAGVTGPLRPGLRGLMSPDQAGRGRPAWAAGSDAAHAQTRV